MKTLPFIISLAFLFMAGATNGQILKKLKKSVERTAERKLENKVERETSNAMDSILTGNTKQQKTGGETMPSPAMDNTAGEKGAAEADAKNAIANNPVKKPALWTKYNFIPGDKIIFQDDLAGEENGEFPSRWDLLKGNAENALFGGEKIIHFTNKSTITPLMKTSEYLPDVFTIEFDAFYDKEVLNSYAYHMGYRIRLWNGNSHITLPDKKGNYQPIHVYRFGAFLTGRVDGQRKDYRSFDDDMLGKEPLWRHIAIAFNKRSLKVFIDEFRALNIPNLGFEPKLVSIEGFTNTHRKDDYTIGIKNIRIAEGGKDLYGQVVANGRFVTRGILFDVNKATIKPESMGVINEVARTMKEHPELNFKIEGHTDSDGADDYNLKLSAQRAAAVKETLVGMGINSGRLKTTGMGESVPVTDNTSPEGKANNRRVEFVKM